MKKTYTGDVTKRETQSGINLLGLHAHMRLNINLVNLARLDIKNVARNRHVLDRSILPQKLDIGLDALLQILDGQE